MPQTKLHRKTLALVQKDKRTTLEIASAAEVPYHWLAVFRRGNIRNPSVDRVVKLYEHLTGVQLEVR